LALVSVVSSEALAKSLAVVADSTSGAVTSLGVSVSEEDISSGGALLEGAVRSTEAKVTLTSDVLECIPRGGVDGGSSRSSTVGGGKGRLGEADSTPVAVGGAHGPLAGHALISIVALALSRLAVAGSLVGALDGRMSIVGSDGNGSPGEALRAGTEGAVVLGPGRVAVGAIVAGALVYMGRREVVRGGVRSWVYRTTFQ